MPDREDACVEKALSGAFWKADSGFAKTEEAAGTILVGLIRPQKSRSWTYAALYVRAWLPGFIAPRQTQAERFRARRQTGDSLNSRTAFHRR